MGSVESHSGETVQAEEQLVYVARRAGKIAASGRTMDEVNEQLLRGVSYTQEPESSVEEEREAAAAEEMDKRSPGAVEPLHLVAE